MSRGTDILHSGNIYGRLPGGKKDSVSLLSCKWCRLRACADQASPKSPVYLPCLLRSFPVLLQRVHGRNMVGGR